MSLRAKAELNIDSLELNHRQLLMLTKIANYGVLTRKMLALYFAIDYPDVRDKIKAVENTGKQLIQKDLIKKIEVGFGEYRVVYILRNKGKIVTENENIYYLKASQKIYQSGFRHQIIANHISIFVELLKKDIIVRNIPENQIRKMKLGKKWVSKSIPDYLFTTKDNKMIIIEYEKNLKNDPRKLVEKLINYKDENLKSIKNGVEKIYYFVANKRKEELLKKYFERADLIAKEYPNGYQNYLKNRAKVSIKNIEEVQEIFLKKYNCFELKSEEIYLS